MLTTEQTNIILETLKPFDPTYIGLFGSYARNEETESSDIDLLYEFNNPTFSLFDLIDLKETLQQKLNKQVDLVSKRYINKHLKSYVEKDIKILFNV
ncbi:MAG: nucleotidyltransferase domain-containing protein [Bacteroidetes bacterium]|nr:nucleotidyltransferase domain-containing protein [Bacteroidota bacterium]